MTCDLFDGGSQCFGWAFQTVSLCHLKLQRQLEEYSLRLHAFSFHLTAIVSNYSSGTDDRVVLLIREIWHINKRQDGGAQPRLWCVLWVPVHRMGCCSRDWLFFMLSKCGAQGRPRANLLCFDWQMTGAVSYRMLGQLVVDATAESPWLTYQFSLVLRSSNYAISFHRVDELIKSVKEQLLGAEC